MHEDEAVRLATEAGKRAEWERQRTREERRQAIAALRNQATPEEAIDGAGVKTPSGGVSDAASVILVRRDHLRKL